VNWCRYFEKIAIDPNVNVKHMQAIRIGAVDMLCSQIVILHASAFATRFCTRRQKAL